MFDLLARKEVEVVWACDVNIGALRMKKSYGNGSTIQYNTIFLYFSPAYMQCTCRVMTLNIFWSITSGKQWLYNNAQFCLFFTTVIRKIIYTIQ